MNVGVLTSFWYFRRYDYARLPADVPLIIDSGAFSAFTSGGTVDLLEFGEYLDRVTAQRPIDFAFNLDVLGDEEQSLRNWHSLREMGHLTTPVIHFGSKLEDTLPAYLEAGADRLSLGGLASPGGQKQKGAWTAHCFKYLRDHGLLELPVHGLGVHTSSALARFPFATTDSSAPGAAWTFGRARLWSGKRWVNITLDGQMMHRYGAISRRYGFEPGEVAESTPESRRRLVELVTRSEIAAADHFAGTRRRYLVSTSTEIISRMAVEAVAPVKRYLVDARSNSGKDIEQTADLVRRYTVGAPSPAGEIERVAAEMLAP